MAMSAERHRALRLHRSDVRTRRKETSERWRGRRVLTQSGRGAKKHDAVQQGLLRLDAGRLDDRPPFLDFGLLITAVRLSVE
jgi:hypothetical protein